jgi:cAMP-dependent protein kinase regulator
MELMIKGKPSIEHLDQYIAAKEYDAALTAIEEALLRRPDAASLKLRRAEILVLSDDVPAAVGVYRRLAEEYIEQGFYARAIAVANKMLRVDPSLVELTNALAQRISSRQEADRVARDRLEQAAAPALAHPAGESPRRPGPTPDEGPAAVEDEARRERDSSRFFAAFPPAALEELLAITTVRSFNSGEVIVREGDPGTSLFLIVEGHVDVRTSDPGGRELGLARLGPGDFFGEVSVLTGRPRTATIVARENVTAIEIERDLLTGIAGRHPGVDAVLREFYERRAQATVEAMLARLRGQSG